MSDASHRPAVQRRFAPVAQSLAGKRWFPLWALVHHRGRRSGTEYATPIAVVPTRDKGIVLIGLPWGKGTNWARNVLAAGGADLIWKGGIVHTTAPRIVEADEAAALTRSWLRPIVRRMPAAIVLTRR